LIRTVGLTSGEFGEEEERDEAEVVVEVEVEGKLEAELLEEMGEKEQGGPTSRKSFTTLESI